MQFRPDLSFMILSALSGGPRHGYAVFSEIKNVSGGLFKLGEGQLYPILHRLEADGAITGEWEEQYGRPSRRVYKLTPTGKASLEKKRGEWTQFREVIDRVVANHKK